jgi:3-isopropylmalate dehydrogenase
MKSVYNVALMRGDGIGPEIISATLKVLDSIANEYHFRLDYKEVPAGDGALKEFGDALPKESLDAFAECDACLKGPVGETVMDINLKLRFGFDLYANMRPCRSYPGISPPAIRPDIDLVVLRENSEGFYKALENEITPGIWTASGVFTEKGARRIAEFSFNYTRKRSRTLRDRRPKVTLATKANIFRKTHGMYVRLFKDIAKENPDIIFEHIYADAMCARLVRDPQNFDVIVSENLLADLLSDLGGQVAGGLGMTPGTNINYETKHAYFEPTHGSAPDIVGKGVANPIGQIRSGALMLEYLGLAYDDSSLVRGGESIENSISLLLNTKEISKLPRELGGQADAMKVAEVLADGTKDL